MVAVVHVLADSILVVKDLQSSCQAFTDLLTSHIMPSRQHLPREDINRNPSEESDQNTCRARVSSHVFQC
jgi:hypothetical protein